MGVGSSTATAGNSTNENVDLKVDSPKAPQEDLQAHPNTTPPPGCPMHEQRNKEPQNDKSQCPMNAQNERDQAKVFYPSECPMNVANRDNKENADAIDPLNLMPPPNQQPSPGQPFLLSTQREKSSIAKAGTDGTWVYPSQQMFWNAMLKKGWRWEKDDLKESDMENIISMHNMNNERAWQEVLKWESFHAHECGQPKLLKFGGKAKEFSPRARIRHWLGYDLPFDRHDWIVDRCGKEVRYIIDYYDVGDPESYKKGDFVFMDVRPAFDSFQAVLDRSRVAMLRWAASLSNWSSAKFGAEKSSSNDEKS